MNLTVTKGDRRPPTMARLELLTLMIILLVVAPAKAYTRPPPRSTLSVPWQGKDASHPQQVHTSLAGVNHMRIVWITDDTNVQSIVEYGITAGVYNYTSLSKGDSTSYSYMLYNSGKIHHVVIGPLEANRTYFYRCGGYGPEYNFKTPPAQFPITFTVVGDLGQTGWTSSTLEHIQQCNHDVHILPGDLSYADYWQPLWDSFGRLVEPLASTRPWMVTQGNHEMERIPLFMPPFRAYNARWPMPYEESASSSNLYYSFEVAGVHIVMLGSYTDYYEDSEQYQWLQADLSRVDRMRTPWLIVVFHAPWYNSNLAHQGEGDDMMESMEPLLYDAKVDIVLAGHVHAYERSTRVYMRNADPCGPIHITVGDGGNHEGLASRYIEPQPQWSVFREASFGHGELRIANDTHAHWTWHRNDNDESVRSDEVWIESLSKSGVCTEDIIHRRRKSLIES
uniref:Purple acid phosphatase n=1 Tax=Wollemia nobilis TaxID=56998 RepID=A0A0C9QL22_9CONI